MGTSLTVPLTNKPGQQLVLKIAQYMRPKCHALLLDSGINSETTVRLNIYQVWRVWVRMARCGGRARSGAVSSLIPL